MMPRLQWAALQAVAIGCCAFVYLTQAASAASATVDARVLETAVPSDSTDERCMVRIDVSLPAAGLDCEGDWVAFDCPAEGAGALVGDRMLASSRLALAAGKRVELLVADGAADGVCRTERIKVQDGVDEEADDDGDGVVNLADDLPLDPLSAADLDGDGQGDETDPDDDGDGIPDADDPAPRLPNRAPVAVGSLADQAVFHHGGPATVACFGRTLWLGTLQALFSDPDGDPLSLAMNSGEPHVAAAQLSYLSDDEGSFHAFCILGETAGAATFTLTASDPSGLSASLTFQVAVKPILRIPYANFWGFGSSGSYDVRLGARCGTKICGNEGEGEMGVIHTTRPRPGKRVCWISETTRLTHGGALSFDYSYSSEGTIGSVQVCPRRGGKERGLFTYRTGWGERRRFGDHDPDVYCGVTSTARAHEVVRGLSFQSTYEEETVSRSLLDLLELPPATTVSFSCDGFPNTVPVTIRRLPTQYLTAEHSVTIDLEALFESADWTPLTIHPEVRDNTVASVEVVGTTLRIHPLANGETEVLLNAINEYGSTVNAFSISVGEFVDLFWHRQGGVFHSRSVPADDFYESPCGDYACGRVEGHQGVEPGADGRCPLYEQLKPDWGSVRFRYESSEKAETGERLFEVCPRPAAYPKNLPGWYTYLVDRRGGWRPCNRPGTIDRAEHAQLRFLFEGNGFRLVNGAVIEIPSLESRPVVGIWFPGPFGYGAGEIGGLDVRTQLGVDDFVTAERVCRDD